ncbi:MAG: SpoIIE family protein phosphatase [Acidimicrobiales bacterium]
MPLRLRIAIDALLGVGLPAAVAAVLHRTDDPDLYRPGSLLLFVIVGLALGAGFRAGLVAAVMSVAVIWLFFTGPHGSHGVGSLADGISLVVFAVTAAGVLVLLNRLDRARAAALEQRIVADAMLDGAPVGIGLFDGDGRLQRFNRALVHLQRRSASQVEELLADERHRAALVAVLRGDEPVTDVRISRHADGDGSELHWQADYYPARNPNGRSLGAGVIVTDITGDVVGRRRGEHLLRLAEQLASAGSRADVAATLTSFLEDAFGGRAHVAFVGPKAPEPVDLTIAVEHLDPGSPVATAWHEAARTGHLVFADDAVEHDRRFPDGVGRRVTDRGKACLAVPLVHPERGDVRAVGWVWWPHARSLTATTRTLAETAASVAALALSRIELNEAVLRDRFRAALDAMIDDVAIGRAVRDDAGAIEDFELEFVNRASLDGASRTADELIGRRVCELYPAWRETGMFDRFARVVETGEPWVAERLPYHDELPDGTVIDGAWNLHVVKLGDGYLAASLDVTELVAAEEARRAAEGAVEREHSAVALLQHASLPARFPDRPGVRFGARYRPALTRQAVGGDWYDAFMVGRRIGLVIGDVAGHGPEAAARMVQVRQLVRAVAHQQADPNLVLERVNETMAALDRDDGFVTCCYALIDPDARTLSLATAGHPPPLLTSVACSAATPAGAFVAAKPGPPLAAAAAVPFPLSSQPLPEGARLVLFTDGLVERRGELLDIGLGRLLDATAAGTALDAEELAAQLADAVEEPSDDIAVLVVDVG